MNRDTLTKLSELAGIVLGYWDVSGVWHEPATESRLKVLEILGYDVSSPQALESSYDRLIRERRSEMIKPVYVVSAGDTAFEIRLQLPYQTYPTPHSWSITFENGTEIVQKLTTETCHNEESYEIDGQPMRRIVVPIRTVLPEGYHNISFYFRLADGEHTLQSSLIATPEKCYLPEEIYSGTRYWGVSLQLYSLRSEHNWGIGDIGDLRLLSKSLGKQGASFIGLNPLHALPAHDATTFSPYSPVSRLASNYLYLDLTMMEDFRDSSAAQAFAQAKDTRAKLDGLRHADYVDYGKVSEIKMQVLNLAYEQFYKVHLGNNSSRAQSFRDFCASRGKSLRNYATYQALREHFVSRDPALWGWPVWPDGYKSPEDKLVGTFVKNEEKRILFFSYLEWQFSLQMEDLKHELSNNGIHQGLYLDLALGCGVNSADIWANQELFSLGASMGAPPDAVNEHGQNWGLPVILPHQLEKAGYRPFIDILRYVMGQSGMLRIDHVMQLMRVFWIPTGFDGSKGLYFRYPVSDLMGIIALESQRNRCVVIGEDLGTVPDEVRVEMRRRELLSYQLFIFERDHQGGFTPPNTYIPQALVTSSSHDLPTIMGFWKGREVSLRKELGLRDEYYEETELRQRGRERELLVEAFVRENIELPREILTEEDKKHWGELVAGVNRYLARTPCYYQAIQLEDICLNVEQMNFPGTTFEHPNWQRKLPMTVDDLSRNPLVNRLPNIVSGRG